MSLIKGTLDVLVLKALSWGPMHGFEIVTWLEARSGGLFDIDDGALFQALQRMEERELITAVWGVTENKRRARYYSMTTKGKLFLRDESRRMTNYAEVLTTVLKTRSA